MQRSYDARGPVRLEVYRHLFSALAEEMGAALKGSAFSPNIKERRDYSCAVFDGQGRVVAMGDHMPVHLGAMPMSVAAALAEFGTLASGDVVMLNDPFYGGTHLPDITLVMPVLHDDVVIAYLAVRAHHSDVGGMTPGSMPLAREIFQEGLRIPPVRLMTRGQRNHDIWKLLLANVRTPRERAGDLHAQLGCLAVGERRLRSLIDRATVGDVVSAMNDLVAYGERMLRAAVALIPPGTYEAEDVLEDDGFGNTALRIAARIEVSGDRVIVDFNASAPQTTGGVNAVASITESAVRYVMRCIAEALLGQPLPAGGGNMECVEVRLPPRSIVNASPPASVAAGNVETSQRITDVLLAAFSKALPDIMPAQSQGTMNNLTIGGIDPRTGEPFAYYETMGGGMGASPQGGGLSGVHVHMSNSLNTPIEALEHAYPVRITHYSLERGSGGSGATCGGDGIRRDIQVLADADVSVLSERRVKGPTGIHGGASGAPGSNQLIDADGVHPLPSKATFQVRAGSMLSLRSPGGGGCGDT
jgi:N-methylhydantoinase B